MVICAPVNSLVSILSWTIGILGSILLVVVLVLTLHYRLFRPLRFFVLYLICANVRGYSLMWLGPSPPVTDRWFYPYFYFFWISAFVLSFLRMFVILEICAAVLKEYPVVKAIGWWILAGLSAVLFSWTAYFAVRNLHHLRTLVLTFQQTTDISFALVLLTLMSIGVYYQIRIPQLYSLILIGSCIYSAEQALGSELGRYTPNPGNSPFDFAQRITFTLMIAIWTWAVWRWGKTPIQPPELISQSAYDNISPQIHDRLQELNDKLSDLTGKHRR